MIEADDARRAAARRQESTLLVAGSNPDHLVAPSDIYLLDALADDELAAGVRQLIEEAGHSVCPALLDPRDSGDPSVPCEQARVDAMARCGAMFLALRPHVSLTARSAWQVGFFEAMAAPRTCIFLLPILEKGETFETGGLLSRYPVIELATYRHPDPSLAAGAKSDRNWLQRLIGDRYPELMCRPSF